MGQRREPPHLKAFRLIELKTEQALVSPRQGTGARFGLLKAMCDCVD